MGKRLRMENGEVVDADSIFLAPLVMLDCENCGGYTSFTQTSSTVVVCEECSTEQSNERIVDLNEERK